MKKLSLSLISDTLFTAACTFLITFTAVRHYTRNAAVALGFAISAAAVFGALALLILSAKNNKIKLKAGELKEKNFLMNKLALESKAYTDGLFSSALEKETDATRFFRFTFDPLAPDDIAAVARESGKNKELYCSDVTPRAREIAESCGIKLFCGDEVFRLIKDSGLLPQGAARTKRGFKLFLRIKSRFNRKLSPSLFFCGAGLIFFSFFTFFPVYYIVCGSLLLTLSVVCLFLR